MNAIVELFLINDLMYKVTPKIVPGSSHIVFKSPFGSLKSIKMEYFLTISIIKWTKPSPSIPNWFRNTQKFDIGNYSNIFLP